MNSSRVLTADAVAAFAVFARHRNFTSAAGELHLTQPSLHTKIAKLSRQLDTTLYERVGRELRLTPDGEALAAFANDQQRAADDYLARRADPSRTIHLAAGRASIQWVLDQPLRALVSTGTRLRVTPTNGARAIELVESGAADAAAVGYDPPPRHLQARRLCEVPQVLVVPQSHRLGQHPTIALADLDGESLVVPPHGRPHRQTLERALDAARVAWTVAGEADGWDIIVHLAHLGIGLTIVNGCVPVPEPLRAVEITDLPPVGYWLAWRPQRQRVIDPLLRQATTHG